LQFCQPGNLRLNPAIIMNDPEKEGRANYKEGYYAKKERLGKADLLHTAFTIRH